MAIIETLGIAALGALGSKLLELGIKTIDNHRQEKSEKKKLKKKQALSLEKLLLVVKHLIATVSIRNVDLNPTSFDGVRIQWFIDNHIDTLILSRDAGVIDTDEYRKLQDSLKVLYNRHVTIGSFLIQERNLRSSTTLTIQQQTDLNNLTKLIDDAKNEAIGQMEDHIAMKVLRRLESSKQ